jgi:hypothetical protein
MDSEIQWKKVYLLGGVMTIIGLIGILLDVVIGSVTGGDLSALPQTAIDRFMQFQENPLLGLEISSLIFSKLIFFLSYTTVRVIAFSSNVGLFIPFTKNNSFSRRPPQLSHFLQ